MRAWEDEGMQSGVAGHASKGFCGEWVPKTRPAFHKASGAWALA